MFDETASHDSGDAASPVPARPGGEIQPTQRDTTLALSTILEENTSIETGLEIDYPDDPTAAHASPRPVPGSWPYSLDEHTSTPFLTSPVDHQSSPSYSAPLRSAPAYSASFHSARASPAYSVPYHSARASPAYTVPDHSNWASPASPAPYYSVNPSPEIAHPSNTRTRDSEYNSLLRERGLVESIENELNWSGREAGMGQHVEFGPNDPIPLDFLHLIGSSLTARVDKVRCRRILLARKSMKCNRRLKLQEAINEVEHLQKLHHAHIIQLVGSYLQGRTFSILLYPVADCDLSAFMERVTRALASAEMSIRDYLAVLSLGRFFRCLSNALEFIHSHTTKHMDIKPQNILVKEHYKYLCGHQIYIADFGVSRSFSQLEHSQTDSIIAMSPTYCAPEVYRGDNWGRSADIFSMGCVFLEMWTVLCRRTLDDFADYRSQNDGPGPFHSNLGRVSEWVALCTTSELYVEIDGGDGFAPGNGHAAALMSSMLGSDPGERPKAHELAKHFGLKAACCSMGPECFSGEVIGLNNSNDDPRQTRPSWNTRPGPSPIEEQYLTYSTSGYAIGQAASNGHEEMLKLLLYCGTVAVYSSPLFRAAVNGYEKIVELLIENGAHVGAKHAGGQTALHFAARSGHEKVVRLLIQKGANLNASGTWCGTALHEAVRSGHEEVVALLIENGADVGAEDCLGQTVLHLAAQSGCEKAVKLLVQKGANVNAFSRWGGTVLHEAAGSGCKEIVELLIENGADVGAEDCSGQTVLHFAAQSGHEEMVRLLVQKAAGVGAEDCLGETALHHAARLGHKRVVEVLFKGGADISATTRLGETALHLAASLGHEEIIEVLLGRDTEANAATRSGEIAIHPAGLSHGKVVEAPVENGRDVTSDPQLAERPHPPEHFF